MCLLFGRKKCLHKQFDDYDEMHINKETALSHSQLKLKNGVKVTDKAKTLK